MARFAVFADACVLYSAPLCDLLLECAARGFFRLLWSRGVHAEWMRSLQENRPDLPESKLRRRHGMMLAAFPEAMVDEHDGLAALLKLPDENDRHVLAAAIRGRADAIVTFNLKDFPSSILCEWGVEALHPDDFFISQFDLAQGAFLEAVKTVRSRLRNPPLSAEEYLDVLARNRLSGLAAVLRDFDQLI